MTSKLFRLLLALALSSALAAAQDPPAEQPAQQAEPAEETEAQRNSREISLEALREADKALLAEREAMAKRERRIDILLEDFENQNRALANKEAAVKQMLEDAARNRAETQIPDVQVAHWESRDPQVAAPDFVLLYDEAPRVAVSLIKRMKKKKSARLIDEVAKLGDNGKKVAAELHEAIGVGLVGTQ